MKKYNKKFVYNFDKAIEVIKNLSKKKFKETLDAAVKINSNSKKSKINIRSYSLLPNKFKNEYKIALFLSKNEKCNVKNDLIFFDEDNIKNLNKKKIKFNILITTPYSIKNMGNLKKILNSKKLMPDIRYGTVNKNIDEMLSILKKNYVKFKNDKSNIIHFSFGKINLHAHELKENLETILLEIKKQKAKNNKNIIIEKINISSTMGKNFNININSLFY